jgi:predicted HTH domain antitoxin
MYESGRLTLGQAAEIAGLSKIAFAEILAEYNISIVNYPTSEVIEDAGKF